MVWLLVFVVSVVLVLYGCGTYTWHEDYGWHMDDVELLQCVQRYSQFACDDLEAKQVGSFATAFFGVLLLIGSVIGLRKSGWVR